MGVVEQYLLQLNTGKRRRRYAVTVLTTLSLIVMLLTVWTLRRTGITIANSASCGIAEHQHGEDCMQEGVLSCTLQEHIHSLLCYPDLKADLESIEDWNRMFADYPYTEDLRTDLAGIAKSQVGYAESQRNFELSDSGLLRGYTRYGAWYGAPYNDWSAMFVCFCLNYAGADLTEFPTSSGAASMAELWRSQGKLESPGQYAPQTGDLVFFRDNTVGIVAEVYSTAFYVIRGDIEDAVTGVLLSLTDESITAWGLTGERLPPIVEDELPTEAPPAEEVPTSEDAPVVEPTPLEEEPTTDSTPLKEEPAPESTTQDTPPAEDAEQKDSLTPQGSPEEEADPQDEDPPSEEEPSQPEEPSPDAIPDISNGPVFYIFEGSKALTQSRPYSLRNPKAVIELLPYLEANGGGYFLTLLDQNNMELPKDENGNYIAQANTGYKLTISFSGPEGFAPGTYEYQIPNGLMVQGGSGSFILKDGTDVGTWTVSDTGLITLVFNENMNSRSDITISATMGITFPEQQDPIDFDGKITVTVEKPPEQQFPTELVKWGKQGDAAAGQDPTKLYWNLQITGHKDSQIPGNILSDRVLFGQWSKDHHYTQSDIGGGLSFGISEPDPVTGEFKDWHSWHVSPEDPHLIWTETGWSYKMPLTIVCEWCGEVELGNENWIYTVNYTSTPDPVNTAGTYGYENEATVDGQHAYAWTDFTHGETLGEITKQGSLLSDGKGGNFVWEFQAMIPGKVPDQFAEYHWYIMDYMYLLSKEDTLAGHMENDANSALVTADYMGQTIPVPSIQEATEDDLFAWDNAWTAVNNGVNYGREINLLCRCQCNESNCRFWNGKCEPYWYDRGDGTWGTKGFCQCWTMEGDTTFTFVYTTEALSVIESYGGFGYKLENVAELYYKPNGNSDGALVSGDHAEVPIPGLFKKELTQDFNGYTANYQVTVNEAKAVLTNGSPLYIHDVMTDTLAYISGSLVITAEDAKGNRSTLRQDQHYTVTYDGSGTQTDESGKPVHVLDIVILQPQLVMYILDYDTTLLMPEQFSGAIKYSNSATVTLWGRDIVEPGVEKVYADINIAARSYSVELFKTCAVTGKPLPGATFGLYNSQGGLITSGVTGSDGRLLFRTDVSNGIILREHELYYLQELRPPPAYRLDDTKHWFCFCNGTEESCQDCTALMADTGALRIPFEQIGLVETANRPTDIELPATGGMGRSIYILCGLSLVLPPLVYGYALRRRYGRRSNKSLP